MAISAVESSDLPISSIPVVDLRYLSQSEINSLSLCSDHFFDPHRTDDVVIPKIDRSVFNESAGSRKQTYSRLRLAPRTSDHISTVGRRRRRIPLAPPPSVSVDDPEKKENQKIVSFLRDLFEIKNSNSDVTLTLTSNAENANPVQKPATAANAPVNELAIVPVNGDAERRRKRGRNKVESDPAVVDVEIVNKKGVAIDIEGLGSLQDPFGEELRRRTEGLKREEELLGFITGLEGQWGSRRKKRKMVDAADFGDHLPKGWKLLLSIKRKEGNFWLNCRRYISPSGQQFESCKEVSSYLLSLIRSQGAGKPVVGKTAENKNATHTLAARSTAGLTHKGDTTREVPVCYSAVPISSLCAVPFSSLSAVPISSFQAVPFSSFSAVPFSSMSGLPVPSFSANHEKKVIFFRVENPAKVQLQNHLECHKCNLVFGDKDSYSQHLTTVHQRNPKRCRVGKSIGDGVIMKDGKYECQFCHKIFDERHRYNGHVGVHVRNHVKNLETGSDENVQNNVEQSSSAGEPSMVCNMDASVDIDNSKDSMPKISTPKPNNELDVGSPHGNHVVEHIKTGDTPMCDAPEIVHGTLTSTTVDEQGNDNEMTDGTAGKIVENGKTMDLEPNPCLDAAMPLVANEESIICEASNSKEFSLCKLSDENDKCSNDQERVTADCSSTVPDHEKKCHTETYASGYHSMKEPRLDEVEKDGCKLGSSFEGCSISLPDDNQCCGVETYGSDNSTSSAEEPVLYEKEESGYGLENFSSSSISGSDRNTIEETNMNTDENIVENVVPNASSLVVPSSGSLLTLDMVFDKGEEEFTHVTEKLENISGFEELRFDEIGTSKLDLVSGQDSGSLPEASLTLDCAAELEKELDSSIQIEWDTVLPEMVDSHPLTTVCVWCRLEFNLEGVNPNAQSDSVGFMCSTCKAKISGQLNVLDNGLSLNSNKL